jgi:hypothetical protein
LGGPAKKSNDAAAEPLAFLFLYADSSPMAFSASKNKNAPGGGIIGFVIQLGFEPRTPSLKGMCSTC